ncbi:MAG TPA: hypothetical protein VJZ71_15110 [Phycisphaerae bacterium]|nr:hypothetical protein [Phycisphaerae bacterium]
MPDTAVKVCQGCQSEITNEQIMQRQAGLVHGVLLCPQCIEQKKREAMEAQQRAAAAAAAAATTAPTAPPKDITEEKISLDADFEAAPTGPSKIRSFAAGSTLGGAHHDTTLHRPITAASDPPTRVRTFHSKLTPGALAHMDDLINEWIDSNPGIFIKHVNTTVGPFEAKHVEQHLIVTIFY